MHAIRFALSAMIFAGASASAFSAFVDPELLGPATRAVSSQRVIVTLKDAPLLRGKDVGDQVIQSTVERQQDVFLARHFGQRAKSSVTRMRLSPQLVLTLSKSEVSRLSRDANVKYIVVDRLAKPSLNSSLPVIGIPAMVSAGKTGSNSIIAVLDTGVDTSHPFIAGAGRVVGEACFSSASGGSQSLCKNGATSQTGTGAGANCSYLDNGCYHGTHVAGIVMGSYGTTISGVAKSASVMPIQVFSYFPSYPNGSRVMSWSSDQVRALEYIYLQRNAYGAKKIRAINMSLGGGSYAGTCAGQAQQAMIKRLRDAGIATVIAAGNNGYNGSMASPACIPEAISVAASDNSDGAASFSNISSTTTVFAPGVSIVSAYPGNLWARLSGTSMAAPHVAGSVALLMSAYPAKPLAEVQAALVATGKPVTKGGITKPRIQVDKAYNLLASDISASQNAVTVSRSTTSTAATSFQLTITSTGSAQLSWKIDSLPIGVTTTVKSGLTGTSVTFTVASSKIVGTMRGNIVISEVGTGGPVKSIPVTITTVKKAVARAS